MSKLRVAMPPRRQIKPAFTVKKLDGERELLTHTFDAKGQRQSKLLKVPAGYLIKFSKGHSIRVSDENQLKRLGFDQTIELIDDATGDVHGYLENSVLDTDNNDGEE